MTELSQILGIAIDIGETMLTSGGEVARVEDTIGRICMAYDDVIAKVDVFSITESIMVTVTGKDGSTFTQTRRIISIRADFTKLDKINNLSRYICKSKPDEAYIRKEYDCIIHMKEAPEWTNFLAYAIISAAFSLFFGGSAIDSLCAGVIGLVMRYILLLLNKVKANQIFTCFVTSLVAGILALAAIKIDAGDSFQKIAIGNIMPLIPGLQLVNSLRDLIGGDLITGMLRLLDVIVVAATLAVGFSIAELLLGGVLA